MAVQALTRTRLTKDIAVINADQALQQLKEGNARFVANQSKHDPASHEAQRAMSTDGQTPFAVILGCSDSRVPVEIIFDQSMGDLFVIRVAGNVVANSQVGSVEFSVASFGTPLVVVLGHTTCGAIGATVDELLKPGTDYSPGLRSIVERIEPAIKELVDTDLKDDHAKLCLHAMRANVRASTNALKHASKIIEDRVESGELKIVGAEYDLGTGQVNFYD